MRESWVWTSLWGGGGVSFWRLSWRDGGGGIGTLGLGGRGRIRRLRTSSLWL